MAKRKSSFDKRIVVSGVLVAFSFIVLYIGQFLGDLDLTVSAITSLFVVLIVIEMGYKYAWMTYFATAILSLMLLPMPKTAGWFFTLFMGYYPIIKSYIERMRSKVARWIVKLLVGNAAVFAIYLLLKFLEDMGYIPKDIMPDWLMILTYVLGVLAFVLYDIALTKLITLYFLVIRDRVKIYKFLK